MHGIEQAARTYFGKQTSQLNEAESAMLVGIIRGPHIFSPFRNLDAAREQQAQTLARMPLPFAPPLLHPPYSAPSAPKITGVLGL